MKDEWPKVFKLLKTNSSLDFLKNNTSTTSASVLFLKKSQVSCFNYQREIWYFLRFIPRLKAFLSQANLLKFNRGSNLVGFLSVVQ